MTLCAGSSAGRQRRSHAVAIIGTGPVGCATAAHVHACGIAPGLWSPRGDPAQSRLELAVRGAFEASLTFDLLPSEALRDCDVWIVCLPANAYVTVLEPLMQYWRDGQVIVVSGALSLCPLWLMEAARAQGRDVQVAGWNTTATTAHFLPEGALHANPLRARIAVACSGAHTTAMVRLCTDLLGPRFVAAASLLEITLANINPIAHAAEVIPNLTRMDRGEHWSLFGCFSPVVAQLAEALDAERLAVARAFGITLPTLRAHYAHSYGLTLGALHEMAREIVARGMSPAGPNRLAHRYVLEDGPYGLAVLETLGRLAGIATPVLCASLTLLEVAYGRRLRDENDLSQRLGLHQERPSSLLARCGADDAAAQVPPIAHV